MSHKIPYNKIKIKKDKFENDEGGFNFHGYFRFYQQWGKKLIKRTAHAKLVATDELLKEGKDARKLINKLFDEELGNTFNEKYKSKIFLNYSFKNIDKRLVFGRF